MILTVNEIKEKIAPICKKYGVKKAYLFGSYARGEATDDSDIDIRIEKGKICSLFELSGFRIDLEENLNKEIDLISTVPPKNDILFELFSKNLKRDEIVLYENQ